MTAFEDTVEWTAKGEYATIEGWGGPYDTWLYRRPITVNNASGGVLTDYQVLVESTPANHTYAHSEADGADIRFTQDDGVTPLDYWIEEWVEDGTSTIWIEIDNIPTGENACAYIYYGKSGASDSSDPNTTFLFYDGFEDGDTTDAGDFFITSVNRASVTQARSGAYSMKLPQVIEVSETMSALTLNSVKIDMWLWIRDVTTRIHSVVVYDNGGVGVSDQGAYLKLDSGKLYSYNGSDWIDTGLAYSSSSVWKKLSILQGATTHDLVFDASEANDLTNRNTIANIDKISVGRIGADDDAYYDDFGVRKCASTEPSNAVGAEAEAEETPAIKTDLASLMEWDAKGMFGTPSIAFFDLIEWEAKGGVAMTTQGDYQTTVEWIAKSNFKTPNVFVFIDLR